MKRVISGPEYPRNLHETGRKRTKVTKGDQIGQHHQESEESGLFRDPQPQRQESVLPCQKVTKVSESDVILGQSWCLLRQFWPAFSLSRRQEPMSSTNSETGVLAGGPRLVCSRPAQPLDTAWRLPCLSATPAPGYPGVPCPTTSSCSWTTVNTLPYHQLLLLARGVSPASLLVELEGLPGPAIPSLGTRHPYTSGHRCPLPCPGYTAAR